MVAIHHHVHDGRANGRHAQRGVKSKAGSTLDETLLQVHSATIHSFVSIVSVFFWELFHHFK